MESVEEGGGDHNCSNEEQFAAAASAVARGKRTKRQRLAPGPASPAEASSSAEEDEDMANCLILLAQGGASRTPGAAKVAAAADAYRCKTCDKTFASFQALGGHRTSHKKPKTAAPLLDHEKKPAAEDETDGPSIAADAPIPKPVTTTSSSNDEILAAASAKQRVHECSVCGSEFSSGQALGGHMRRHRPLPPEVKKEKNIFLLDLNLPAPADDDDSQIAMAFPFETRRPPLIFSTSSLVDCHY
ncbi:zinc finger protein ZAT5-like [Zingiber officinale]|nr:zinc finger protein ZAT5-like [Zingiber officinale]